MRWIGWFALAVAVAVGAGYVSGSAARADDAKTVDEIEACVQRNFPEVSGLQHVEIESEDRAEARRTLLARVHWKRFEKHPRVMIKIDDPAEVRGAAYLAIGEDNNEESIYMYLPAIGATRRVSATTVSDSLWETDFSYEDMKYLQGIEAQGTRKRLPDAELEGRGVYVVETRPGESHASGYERVVSFVERERCIPLRAEFFEEGEHPRKRLDAAFDSIVEEEGRFTARNYLMRDLKNETRTWLRVTETEHNPNFSNGVFSPSRLDRVR